MTRDHSARKRSASAWIGLTIWALAASAGAAPGDIHTVAGAGDDGALMDGVYATEAQLVVPNDTVMVPNGDILVADGATGRVRKVDHRTGLITTVAGAGRDGDYDDHGDGVLAVDAYLSYPSSVAVENDGSLIIADAGLDRIFRVDAETGRIATVAGTGERGLSGDGGPAIEAQLAEPWHVAHDLAGNILVVDRRNGRVRWISTQQGTIVTLGGPVPSFEDPVDVVVNGRGEIFVADRGANRVWRASGTDTVFTVFAGTGESFDSGDGGPPGDAGIREPNGLAIDAVNTLLIAGLSNRIRAVSTISADPIITTVAGTGEAGFAGDGGPAIDARLDFPGSMSVDRHGNLFLVDAANDRVRVIESAARAFIGEIYSNSGGGVLAVPDGNTTVGAQVVVTHEVTERPEQTWTIERSGLEGYRFRGIGNQCLQPGAANADGDVEMEMGPCAGSPASWLVGNLTTFFNIRKPEPQTCLTTPYGPGDRPVIFESCGQMPSRGWYLSPRSMSAELCLPNDRRMCLNNGRFAVEVDWVTPDGGAGTGTPVGERTDDSGLFYFFNPTNWEMLVKVLDNCDGPTNRYWVFAAASTTVEYTLRVTDTRTGDVRTYFNAQGNRAAAIADVDAFATCP